MIAVELQMVPYSVHPGMGGSGSLAEIEGSLLPSAKATLDDVVWWAKATMAAKPARVPEVA